MAYPTYRQDFEGGTTLATACPELTDFDSAYAINTVAGNSFTGTNSLKLATIGSSHSCYSNVNDLLSGNVTLTAYMLPGTNNGSLGIFGRQSPTGVSSPTSYVRCVFGTSGIDITQNNSGTVTHLNTPLSNVTTLAGQWLCIELRCNGTTISTRVVRQDTGQFWYNLTSPSWSSSPPAYDATNSGTAVVSGTGGIGLRVGDNSSCYIDDFIYEPAVPAIDHPSFTISGLGNTQQLTAGGYTDPLHGVTWSSSNTGIATVSSSGVVTAIANGTFTITATGKRDTGQTATAAGTVSSSVATSYTFTGPTSGQNNTASTNFTLTPNGVFTGTITVTFTGGGGPPSPITKTWSGTATPQTFTITPTASGTIICTPTNTGSLPDASVIDYLVLAATYTITGPSSGIVGITQVFTVTPDASYNGTITLTPSGVSSNSAITNTWSNALNPQTYSFIPSSTGTLTLTGSNNDSLTDHNATDTISSAPATGYTITPPSPDSGFVNSTSGNFTIQLNGIFSGTITITLSGAASGIITRTFSGIPPSQTFTITPTSVGVVTLTGSNSGSLSNTNSSYTSLALPLPATTWNYLSTVSGFSTGLSGSVGYTVLNSDGSTYAAFTTAGVFGNSPYNALVALPMSGSYLISWNDGSGNIANDAVNIPWVEPSSANFPGGLNQSQVLAELLAIMTGQSSGFISGSQSQTVSWRAPDKTTVRVAGTIDPAGNRSNISLYPPT